MSTYATYSDVAARNPYHTVDASSKPSADDVSGWVTDAENALHGALNGVSIATPITNTGGVALMKLWVIDYVAGLVKEAYANATGDSSNEDGRSQIDKFWDRLDDIADNGSVYDEKLTGGAAGDSSRKTRFYVLDNNDGKTIAAGDFAPTFTKSRGGTQF